VKAGKIRILCRSQFSWKMLNIAKRSEFFDDVYNKTGIDLLECRAIPPPSAECVKVFDISPIKNGNNNSHRAIPSRIVKAAFDISSIRNGNNNSYRRSKEKEENIQASSSVSSSTDSSTCSTVFSSITSRVSSSIASPTRKRKAILADEDHSSTDKEESQEQSNLQNYFKKTVTEPSVYYLPLGGKEEKHVRSNLQNYFKKTVTEPSVYYLPLTGNCACNKEESVGMTNLTLIRLHLMLLFMLFAFVL